MIPVTPKKSANVTSIARIASNLGTGGQYLNYANCASESDKEYAAKPISDLLNRGMFRRSGSLISIALFLAVFQLERYDRCLQYSLFPHAE